MVGVISWAIEYLIYRLTMKLDTLKPICILYIVLRSITFCWCQANSSDNSSNGWDEIFFPTLVLGKDATALWYANVSFGTPNQERLLRVDIGQPYTWLISSLNGSGTTTVLNDGHIYDFNFMNGIEISGPAVMDSMNFTELDSSGQKELAEVYSINSSSTVEITLDYLSISNISFFEANSSHLTKGSLGLGGKITDDLVSIDSTKFDGSFFFLDRLTSLGVLASPSYSLWLGADNVPYYQRKLGSGTTTDCGRLILGAVDPTLFVGKLAKFDLIPYVDPATNLETRSYPILPLGTIYIISSGGKSLNMTAIEFIEPVLLDSRYSTSYLPIDVIVQIAVQIGATYVESLGRWVVACSMASYGVHLSFSFDDVAIKVPLEDFLVTTFDTQTNTTIHFSNGDEACFLGIISNTVLGFNILGGSFLKNAYTAFDLEDHAMAIAQAKRVTYATGSTASLTSSSAESSTTTLMRRAISSGYIPYAESRNSSRSLTLIPVSVSTGATNVPDLFSGAINSDGLVSTGRSFYETSRAVATSRTTETPYESLLISSIVGSSKTSNGATRNNVPFSISPPYMLESRGKILPQLIAALAMVIVAILM